MKHIVLIILLITAPTWADSWEAFPLQKNGSITVWLTAGPLPFNPKMHRDEKGMGGFYKDFLKRQGGETAVVPCEMDRIQFEASKTVVWKTALSDSSGALDFIEALQVDRLSQGVAYAFCQLLSDRDREVMLRIRSNDGIRLWLNGIRIHDNHVGRSLEQEEDQIQVSLKKGANRLLAKVDQLGGGWGLSVKVTDPDGGKAEGITTRIALRTPLTNKIKSAQFKTSALVMKTPEGEPQLVMAEVLSGGLKNVRFRISSNGWDKPVETYLGDVPLGKHRFEFKTPPITQPFKVILESSTDRKEFTDIPVQKTRQWTIYLVQHVHTDIGYTRPQTEILPEHLRYIDYALDYCDLTDDYPDDAKFRWTCEITWAVREYLKRRPAAQIERLKRRVKQGRIEIAGMFLNMAEIATESSMAASLQPVRTLKHKYGFPVRTAMQNDVNGAAWCLVDYFSGIGIEFLTMGINKTRSLLPFDVPTVFWWESPAGNRVLAFRSDHYHTGNKWKIHTGDLEAFKTGLLGHLNYLEDKGYPFDRIAIKYSGYHTDNSPPATIECDLVKQWNQTYAWPKLRIATAQEFLGYVKQKYAHELPVHRQAWPDWWTDGFGSAARETAASRDTHSAMQINETLLAMASSLGVEIKPDVMQRVDDIQDLLLFYDEHTYGAAESISDPMAENSMTQWGEKSSYVWEAVKNAGLLREEAMGLLQEYLSRQNTPSIAVFNTLNWKRSGLITVFIDHEILPTNREFQIVNAVTGKDAPAQLLRSRAEGSYWALWVEDIPALGYSTYRIEVGSPQQKREPKIDVNPILMTNSHYALMLDPETAAVKSLIDKATGHELVDDQSEWKLGQLIYESLTGGREFYPDAFTRSSLRNITIKNGADGPIWKSRLVFADLDGCAEPGGAKCEIRLFKTEKRIEFQFIIRKKPVTGAEAVYVAFPFRLPDGTIVYEAQGGFVTPGDNQIPRSSSDWQTVQNFTSIRNPDGQIVLVADQAPLVQFGDINLGKWQERAVIERPHVFSWLMNNYWFTNFRASQEGEVRFNYAVTSTKDPSNTIAVRFGWETRIPLVTRVLPQGVSLANRYPISMSVLGWDAQNLLLVDARPARYGAGIILHIREIEGRDAELKFSSRKKLAPIRQIDEVNVLEEALTTNKPKLSFKPYETKFVRLLF